LSAPDSFSRVPMGISVLGKGKFKAEIIKHLAPSTSSSIIRKGKIAGRATLEPNFVIVLTNIKAGPEKQKNRFAAGDIAFLPLNGSLCIFVSDSSTSRPMNHVGRVIEDLGKLKMIGRGDTVVFEVEEATSS
jgi:hypothetical protein